MYSAADLPPVNRTDAERQTDHPLMQAWMKMRVSKTFARDDVRDMVAPVYMGLIKELDDQMGRLFQYLKELHFEWSRQHHNRITRSAEIVEKMTDGKEPPGIMIGFVDEDELRKDGRSLPKHIQ